MEIVSKKYLSEREILELINSASDSICLESSAELFSESDGDTESFPDCDNNDNLFALFTSKHITHKIFYIFYYSEYNKICYFL